MREDLQYAERGVELSYFNKKGEIYKRCFKNCYYRVISYYFLLVRCTLE